MALLPADVLYTAAGERVCGRCWVDPGQLGVGRRPASVGLNPPRTARERRLSVLRWSLLFAILAASTLHVRQIALTELRMVCPRVLIDAPAAGDLVPAHFVVRGRVAVETITRPLWVVARSEGKTEGKTEAKTEGHAESGGGPSDLLPRPIVADMFGEFAAPLDLLGVEGQRYRIFVVSADEMANVWLESAPRASAWGATPGMTVLGSIDVVLGL
ncbi:MAG TPA: hypothetical protein VIU64_06725 [Polyangia bacterium]